MSESVNPVEWIAQRLAWSTLKRPPMLYVAHRVAAQPGDVLATCVECQRQALHNVDAREPVCERHDSVSRTEDPTRIVAFNLSRALRWWSWLRKLEDAVFSIPWAASVMICDDTNPAARALGMRENLEHVKRFDAVILTGPRVSSGMRDEAVACRGEVFRVETANGEPRSSLHPSEVPWRRWQVSEQGLGPLNGDA